MRKICVVTGTRAEYGLLYWVLKKIKSDFELELQLVVTGMHLSPEFGLTFREIEKDGFEILEKVEILLSSDTATGVAKSVGLATISFVDVFERLKPDFLMILGDRFELLAAAQAALFSKLPIAHLAGGDVTEGAYDEAIRHSITKMAQLHFVTNKDSARRVRQLGESAERIFTVGNPGLDHFRLTPLLSRSDLEAAINFKLRERNLLVTFHPVTLDLQSSKEQCAELICALEQLPANIGIIITKPNADNEGRALISLMEEFAAERDHVSMHTSLGHLRYLSAVREVDVVVGNSSSGILEVPSLKTATVNIGDRQKGRLQAVSVVNCQASSEQILEAIKVALELDCSEAVNPYGDGYAADKIIAHIKNIENPKSLVKKKFYDLI